MAMQLLLNEMSVTKETSVVDMSRVAFLSSLLMWRLVLQLLRKIRMCLRKSCHGEALWRRGHEHLGV